MRIENLIKLTKRKKQGRIYRGAEGAPAPLQPWNSIGARGGWKRRREEEEEEEEWKMR